MKFIFPPIVGFLITVFNLVAWFFVLIAYPFAKWDKEVSPPRNADGIPVVMGDLPWWANWALGTPDIRLPGDTCEEAVKVMYLEKGRFRTTLYWLGVRNCLMNLAVNCGHGTTDYIPEYKLTDVSGFWERTDTKGYTWRFAKYLGTIQWQGKSIRIVFVCGHQVYKVLDGSFRAAPVCTLKKF